MLEQLSVRSYVLIDRLDISFSDGFTVLTGETGSGKSIMLGALALLLGAKADREAVRQGEESAEISGVFTVLSSPQVTAWTEAHGIEVDDGVIVIRRLIRVNGRSVYTVNGSPVTVKEGEELGHLLVDVSSQHAHQSLPEDPAVAPGCRLCHTRRIARLCNGRRHGQRGGPAKQHFGTDGRHRSRRRPESSRPPASQCSSFPKGCAR